VHVHRIVLDRMAVSTDLRALPAKPSIAVLPFANMSGDSEQDYLSDGLAEDIITLLSQGRSLFVIARNSSFTYKGRATGISQIARELGVRYVLEGSVRRAGNRVRVTAQLAEAQSGCHLWAQRYDRDLSDVFALQDEIAHSVVTAIEPALAEAERQRAIRRPPESLSAWEAYQRGLWHLACMSPEDCARAKEFLTRAIDLDPNFAAAHARITIPLIAESTMYEVRDLGSAVEEALTHARRAIALDPDDAVGRSRLSVVLALNGDYDGALAEGQRAVAMAPNSAIALADVGMTLRFAGKLREGIQYLQEGLKRDPYDPIRLIRWSNIAIGYYCLGDYENTVETAKSTIRAYPSHPWAYRWLAAALGQLGRIDEAQQALQKGIALAPSEFERFVRHRPPWTRAEDHERLLAGLRKAGWEA
jgi:adenylate cyclase